MDLYAETILDHYRHPHGKRVLKNPTITHSEKNLSCGDALSLSLVIEKNIITEIGWSGEGCAISQAAMSMLSETVWGKTPEEIDALSKDSIFSLLKVPISARRMKCALLGLHTLKNAIRAWQEKPMQTWAGTMEHMQ